MPDVEKALLQIADIRAQLVASTRFHGFAPATLLTMAMLASLAAVAQLVWPDSLASSNLVFVEFWAIIIIIGAVLLSVEAFSRARMFHGAMSDTMLMTTMRLILPFAAAKTVLTIIICRFAPESVWLVPGLWLILIALVGFCALTNLPRAIMWPAGWFFLCGTIVLLKAGGDHVLSPWMMGVPFTVGYAMIAFILHRSGQEGGACD